MTAHTCCIRYCRSNYIAGRVYVTASTCCCTVRCRYRYAVVLITEGSKMRMTYSTVRSIIVHATSIDAVSVMMASLCMTNLTDSVICYITICVAVHSGRRCKYYRTASDRAPDSAQVRLRAHRVVTLYTVSCQQYARCRVEIAGARVGCYC